MPYNLEGRNVLVTGGSRGLGALVCKKFAAEGCSVAINFANREQPATELSDHLQKEYGVKTAVIHADVGVTADCVKCVQQTIEALGGIDIIVGNAGWTRFSKFDDLYSMEEHEWDKCWAVNVKGQMALVREALPTFNANPEGGVFLITSSVAGVAQSGSSMPYSVTKAAQLHLMKCLASSQGPKVRVNAVLPGLLLTEWGLLYSEEAIKSMKERAVLKKETDLDDCANTFVMLAKNTSMTGMKIQVDAGLFPGSA
ncbi:short chain dehydrogenase [Viridothelium virens]|uniref:Short chain dehydrogenase n=1 Tax=Viridothelium virens TaxID=1048519 RepID=A0A6A6H0K0_VIRVR|nr:short chain dehydrogenase [Viridothelium virens]